MPSSRFANEFRTRAAAGYRQVLAEAAPDLARALEQAHMNGKLRGFGGELGFMRQCWGPGWALVGDAGYFRDPLTAHGITDAFRDAHLLSRAVVEGSDRALATYQEMRDDLASPIFAVTDRIASFEWDLESLQRDHRTLAKEMSRGADWLAEQVAPATTERAPFDAGDTELLRAG
jgi:2-polyprenyl-6-methoxyphenol hydroxylase-like FAD-dependent oxidoreductase